MTSIAENILFTRLCDKIEDKKESMIELTQDLIKIPTLNPPGENYREICEYLDTRLSRAGFATELIRAKDAPGDSDQYPRWNIVCLLYTSPSPRDATLSRMPSSA